jgi:hypothetical protein
MLETVLNTLYGVLPDGAGIEQNDTGILFGRCRQISFVSEQRRHDIAVGLVHLTAEGVNVKLRWISFQKKNLPPPVLPEEHLLSNATGHSNLRPAMLCFSLASDGGHARSPLLLSIKPRNECA